MDRIKMLRSALLVLALAASPGLVAAQPGPSAPTADDALAFMNQAFADHAHSTDTVSTGGRVERTDTVLIAGDRLTVKEEALQSDEQGKLFVTTVTTYSASLQDVLATTDATSGQDAVLISCRSGSCVSLHRVETWEGERMAAKYNEDTTDDAKGVSIRLNDPSYAPRIVKAFQVYQEKAVKPSAF